MTNKSEKINIANSSLPEGQNPTAQTKRTDLSTKTELTHKEILEIIKEKSQIEGNYEGFKSLHR